jgi:hypothetical protein
MVKKEKSKPKAAVPPTYYVFEPDNEDARVELPAGSIREPSTRKDPPTKVRGPNSHIILSFDLRLQDIEDELRLTRTSVKADEYRRLLSDDSDDTHSNSKDKDKKDDNTADDEEADESKAGE